MTLIKRTGINHPFTTGYFDDFFGKNLFDLENSEKFKTKIPAANILENNNGFVIELAAPGLDKKDFQVEIENDVLTIKSEVNKTEPNEDLKVTRTEFSLNSFSRSFTLPEIANVEKISAEYINGILRLDIPKKEEAKPKGPKVITIV
jgi:HSP20 family protein